MNKRAFVGLAREAQKIHRIRQLLVKLALQAAAQRSSSQRCLPFATIADTGQLLRHRVVNRIKQVVVITMRQHRLCLPAFVETQQRRRQCRRPRVSASLRS